MVLFSSSLSRDGTPITSLLTFSRFVTKVLIKHINILMKGVDLKKNPIKSAH